MSGVKDQRLRTWSEVEDLSEADRQAYWREVVCRDTYAVTPTFGLERAPFAARIDVRDRGRFGFAEVESTEQFRERSRVDIARDAADQVVVFRAMKSLLVADEIGREQHLMSGDLCIVPTTRTFRLGAAGGIGFRSLIIPHATLSPLVTGGRIGGLSVLTAGTPLGSLLGGALDVAWDQALRLDERLGDGVLDNIGRLVALAGDHFVRERALVDATARHEKLVAVKRHAESRLGDPKLGPDTVAHALGISVRQLHALFEGEPETFSRWLTAARLEACRATLASPAASHRSIIDIAFGYGFTSLATFYRSFQAAYGGPPGWVRTNFRD